MTDKMIDYNMKRLIKEKNGMSNQQNSYEKRSDVPKDYTWAMDDLYASNAE